MKYIVVQNPTTEGPEALLFCESLAHSHAANGRMVFSAGLCNVAGEVWGHSEGLGIKSRPADSALVKLALTIALNPKPEPRRRRIKPLAIACLLFSLATAQSFAVESRPQLKESSLRVAIVPSNCGALVVADCHSKAEPETTFERLADAILRAEGVWTYGVKTVVVTNGAQARRVCLNTIRHAWADWNGQGDFIGFLGDRYCPPSCDAVGNRNWKRNVRSIYRQSL